MHTFNVGIPLVCLALASPLPSLAEQENTVLIRNSGQGYSGNIMLNQAAGVEQQQVNTRAISAGEAAPVQILQQRGAITLPENLNARVRIEGSAFSQGNGVLGVNQSAGIGNQQINAFRMAVGAAPESLDDSSLAQNAAPLSRNSGAALPNNGERLVELDDRAFVGSRGAVQLNQSAGVGNRTVNHLGIRIAP